MDGHQCRRRRSQRERRAPARHAPPARRHDYRSGCRRHQPRRRERVQRKWSIPPAGADRDDLRADPADGNGRDVHHRRVPAQADRCLADRRPPPRPAAGRQGRRDRRGRFRRRTGRRHPRGRRRHAPAARQPGLAGFAAHRGTDGRRHRGAARRGRGARARDRHHRAAQRAGGRHRDPGDLRPVSVRLRPAVGVAAARQRPGRGRRLAAAGHPARRLVRTAGGSPVSSAQRPLLPERRVLPARAVGRAGGGVRVGGRRARAGLLPAAPERRMSLTARVAPPRYLLGQALHAEWTKFRTVAGPSWLLAGVVALTVAVAAAAAGAARCQSAACGIDPATVSFAGIYPGQALAAVAGVLAIGSEYSTGMIKLSLIAVPRRLTWLCAKAAVLAAPVLTASALAVAGTALAGRLILPGHGFTPAHGYASLTSATDARAAAGAVLYLTLITLLGLGLAAAVRDPAAAI